MSTPPPWLSAGRDFYRAAFEKRTRAGLDASIDDWMHLNPEEHTFVTNHLLYLNLLAQADQVALLEDLRRLLTDGQAAQEELVEALVRVAREPADGDGEELEGFYGPEEADEPYEPDEDGFYEDPAGSDEAYFDEEPDEEPEPLDDTSDPHPATAIVLDVPVAQGETRVVGS